MSVPEQSGGAKVLVALVLVICLIAVLGGYIMSQQPRFYFGLEKTGVALLKGRYRAWLWRWCDGYTYQITNKDGKTALVPVVIESNGASRIGYRWIPKFQHSDMGNIFDEHGKLKDGVRWDNPTAHERP